MTALALFLVAAGAGSILAATVTVVMLVHARDGSTARPRPPELPAPREVHVYHHQVPGAYEVPGAVVTPLPSRVVRGELER
jgi:hypothetical protein